MIARVAAAFAVAPWRVPADLGVGVFFVFFPGLALQILGAPPSAHTEAFASLFGAALVFKGFVHRALLSLPGEAQRPFVSAMAVFEGLLALLLVWVVFRGTEVSITVAVAASFFTIKCLLDSLAQRPSR